MAFGDLKRLMVFMPPRHGKSEFVSHYFPAWFLSSFPDKRIILTSYEATFAATWGRKVRNTLAEAKRQGHTEVELAPDSKAAASWNIRGRAGGMHTGGVGGALTGYGGDLLLIDDPVKNAAQAYSHTYRENAKEWYRSTFRTRAEPGAAIVVVVTRWHEDDLAGWLLRESGEEWEVISLPALAEENDPLGRPVGAALWPQRYDEAALALSRTNVGSYWWAALYQQRPAPREGGMFKRHWFQIMETLVPSQVQKWVRYWDKAATEGGGDWTVGVKMAKLVDGAYVITDVQRDQLSSSGVRQQVKQTSDLDGHEVPVAMEQEPGSAGKDVAEEFKRLLTGVAFHCEPVTGSKALRAEGLAAQAEAGNVLLLKGDWNADFLEEVAAFNPAADGVDDQVDAASGAFGRLTQGSGKPFFGAV